MSALLALISAATFGTGDFLGGLASRRVAAASVVLWSYLLSTALLGVVAPMAGGELTARDLAFGGAAGVIGSIGIGLLYQALAIGPMSAIAPITALLAAAVPVAVGVVDGERPGIGAVAGMVIAAGAVVLVSAEGGGSLRPGDLRGVTRALAAGLMFGLFYVTLSHTDDNSGLWPLLGARAAAVIVMIALVVAGRLAAPRPGGAAARLTAAAGVFDVAGNAFYLLAIREGLLSVTTVVASLYPAATVFLAWLVLKERFAPLQRVGLVLAVPAIALLAA